MYALVELLVVLVWVDPCDRWDKIQLETVVLLTLCLRKSACDDGDLLGVVAKQRLLDFSFVLPFFLFFFFKTATMMVCILATNLAYYFCLLASNFASFVAPSWCCSVPLVA